MLGYTYITFFVHVTHTRALTL